MPRIEKGFGERSTDDIVRDILREYSNRENPISAKNIDCLLYTSDAADE